MTYPEHTDKPSIWLEWVNQVAPLGGPCEPGLHPTLRFLTNIRDRELAALSARGAVQTLRERCMLYNTQYDQRELWT